MLKELRIKRNQMLQRAKRTRTKLHGTAERPRMSIHVSLRHISVQLINDDAQATVASVTTVKQKALDKKTMTEKAAWVGEQIAEAAKKAKVQAVILDRGAKQYHGRVAALADAARQKGLEI